MMALRIDPFGTAPSPQPKVRALYWSILYWAGASVGAKAGLWEKGEANIYRMPETRVLKGAMTKKRDCFQIYGVNVHASGMQQHHGNGEYLEK